MSESEKALRRELATLVSAYEKVAQVYEAVERNDRAAGNVRQEYSAHATACTFRIAAQDIEKILNA